MEVSTLAILLDLLLAFSSKRVLAQGNWPAAFFIFFCELHSSYQLSTQEQGLFLP